MPGDFVEIAPFFGVLLCLPVTLLFLWLGLVFRRLFVRALKLASEVKIAKNSKLPKLPENYFEQVGKGGWPPIST